MSKTAKITLGGVDYTIHAFNIGELRKVATIIKDDKIVDFEKIFDVVRMALSRSEPPVSADEFEMLEPHVDEMKAASDAILQLAGLQKPADPQEGAAAVAP